MNSAGGKLKSGLDLSHVKDAVRPQDDLFRFMNGKWLDESEIPADRASDGAFYWLYQQAEKQVRQIIEATSCQQIRLRHYCPKDWRSLHLLYG
jgi:predicted metalloendopeptidase